MKSRKHIGISILVIVLMGLIGVIIFPPFVPCEFDLQGNYVERWDMNTLTFAQALEAEFRDRGKLCLRIHSIVFVSRSVSSDKEVRSKFTRLVNPNFSIESSSDDAPPANAKKIKFPKHPPTFHFRGQSTNLD